MFTIIPEGLNYKEYVLLKDGQSILFAPPTKKDIPVIKEFMSRLSQESLRMRFMASISEVSEETINNLCEGDFKDSGCLLVMTGEEDKRKVVGLGNYFGTGNGKTAEVAFLIEDSYQGKGISTLLLERLAGLAAANGYTIFEAEVLPENQAMLNVFKNSGFENHRVWNSDTVHIELPVTAGGALWERTSLRERMAVVNSLAPLLKPKTIAVIGASRNIESIGNIIFRNILSSGFTGTIYPVNLQADSVNGVKAFSSIKEIPEKIDLVVIAVKAEKVQRVAEEAINVGAKGLVVVTAGFAESGKEGTERQKKLVELTRANGVRLLGPSCLGLMNTDSEVMLNASLAPQLAPKGSAGFFSHSAALGLVILEYASGKGLGFTTFVSAGNRADVSGNDLLQFWEEDPNTKLAILYLETFGNPRRFVRIAKRMSYKKPILCVKNAKSRAGRIAAETKSGALSGGLLETEALFRQAGIILAETLEELFDIAIVIAHQPLPEGNRIAVIANSAGMATIFADASEAGGLQLADDSLFNLGAFTTPDKYETAVYNSLLNENVDSLLIGYACVGSCSSEPISEAIRKGVSKAEKETGKSKPILLCLMGATGTISLVNEDNPKIGKRKFPAFRFPESAARALSKVVHYAQFKKQSPGNIKWFDDVSADEARKEIQKIIKTKPATTEKISIGKNDSTKILNYFGFNITEQNISGAHVIKINVHQDKLFGPIIELKVPKRPSVIHITPLTDRDVLESLEKVGLGTNKSLSDILGRVSQLIEEIPWLWKLKIETTSMDKSIITNNVLMEVKPAGIKRPAF
jgi:acyl-CoA synthetase (NDP forming)/RimJ/RimL family protein N-acetyltransferase